MNSNHASRAPGPSPSARSPRGGAPSWVTDRFLEIRARLDICVLASALTAASARREFAGWLGVDLAAGDTLDDLVLAVYEALANAAEHAYAGAPAGIGTVQLLARRSHSSVQITISDQGCWRAPTGAAFRSHGVALMHLLVQDVHIERGRTGTVVHLRTTLPAPPASPRP